ncbi:MAG: nicotinamide riboside transporter PnuC [Nanoarchaeota archaeon]|nr:nicotinamide riboside transporter PnuC [Nanoarchaeota archaeon]
MKYLKDWNLFEKIWLLTFTAINVYLFFAWSDTWIGLTASLTGMLCVVLTAKGKISSFYFGLVNILTYSYVAYRSAYYGDVMLNMLYFLPMTFVGIYFWKRNLKKSGGSKTVIVRHFRWDQKVLWFLVSLLAISLYGLFLSYLRGTLPFIDSATTVFSIIATIMLNKRLTDQWFYWIMVDVLSIIMWAYIFISRGADITVLVMWAAFLVNAIYGYYNWRRIEKIQNDKK